MILLSLYRWTAGCPCEVGTIRTQIRKSDSVKFIDCIIASKMVVTAN